jgi:hypothetical protein
MPFGGTFHPEWGALAPAPSFMRTARIVAVATAIGATAGAGVVLSLAGSGDALGPQTSAEAVSDKSLVIVHSLVQPAEAAPVAAQPVPAPVVAAAPVNVPAIAPAPVTTAAMPAATSAPLSPPAVASVTPVSTGGPPPSDAPALPPAGAQASTPVPSDSHTASTPAVPASVAALAEIPLATEASPAPDLATSTPDQTGAPKIGGKKPHGADQAQQTHPQTAAATPQTAPKKRSEEHGLAPLLRLLFSARNGSIFSN